MPLGIWQRLEFGAVNRIVFTYIYIIRIFRDIQIRTVRNIGKRLILGGCGRNGLPVNLRLLKCLLCPLAGNNISSFFIFHQIHRNHGKLLRCAAL